MATNKVKRSADIVTVACRIPQGLTVKLPSGKEVFLHGAASNYATAGHGMTQVKRALWDEIVDHYKDHPGAKWLHNESVFVSGDRDSAEDQAEDRKNLDVGYNPIDPNKPGQKARTGVTIQVEGQRDPGEGA